MFLFVFHPPRHIGNTLIIFLIFNIFFIVFLFQEDDGGLYVCLATFLGFCEEHVSLHILKTPHRVFLHLKKVQKVFYFFALVGKRQYCLSI